MKKILVVDDEPDAIKMLDLTLSVEGYAVVTASDGEEAIRQAVNERPDVIVLDVMMPKMDGFEVSRRLRRMPEVAHIPIIFLSARTQVEAKVEGLRAGGHAYVTKPVAPQELVARIGALLGSYVESVGYVAALFGSEGGVGTTTIAVNLALSLRLQTRASVVLVDGHEEGGDVGVFLNLPPVHHVGELTAFIDQLDEEVFRSALAVHSSGVRVLLAPPDPSVVSPIAPSTWERILGALRRTVDAIIFDGPPLRSVDWMPVIDLADEVFLICTPEITAIRRLKSAYGLARSRGQLSNVHVLLNRYTEQSGFSTSAIDRAVGVPIRARIEDVGQANTYAINRGEPLLLSDNRSPVTRAIFALAREIARQQPVLVSGRR